MNLLKTLPPRGKAKKTAVEDDAATDGAGRRLAQRVSGSASRG